jgi:hypothetical protein
LDLFPQGFIDESFVFTGEKLAWKPSRPSHFTGDVKSQLWPIL